VRVCEGTVVLGSLGEQGRVHGVIVRQGTSGCREVQARFVVGADGPHSRIAGSLGLNRSARWPRRLGLTARYAGDFPATGFGTMVVGSDSYCGLAPLGHGLLNVGLVIPLGAHNSSEPVATLFERQIRGLPGVRSRLGTAERVTDIRGSGPLAHSVRRVAGPGYVLVGDAAGFLDPFTGEGIFRALRGAELAAHVIDAALREGQEATATVARAYRHARTRAFQDKERLCWLVQLFLTQRPLFSYILRRLHSRPNLRAVLAGALGDFGPAASALSPAFLSSLLRP
jgi:flavin-dependent dehydrogenase